jgi:LmbE family N-acetylglucosaminyl deacetylase
VTEPLRVLVMSAHPDDLEFGAAGSVARWVDEGAEATLVLVTDGSTGTNDPALAGARLSEIRHAETMEAADILGIGYVEPTLDLRRDLAREFRKARPHRMVVMDPMPIPGGWFVNHPDHRAVGQASLDVTLTAGTTPGHFPELLDEGFEPWRGLREIFIAGPGGGETAIDVTTTLDRKIAALKAHHSQVGEWEGLDQLIRGWTTANGKEHDMKHAELFHVIRPLGTES